MPALAASFFGGKSRLARWLLKGKLPDGAVFLRHRGGLILEVPSLNDAIGWHLLIDGVYEPHEQAFMKRLLAGGGVFVDVGANVGVHALPLAAQRDDACVLAVEASSLILPLLRANVARNGLCDRLVELGCAAGAAETESAFVEAEATVFGRGSLTAATNDVCTVPVRPLDAIIDECAPSAVRLIKVDVEGFEAGVFRVANRALSAVRKPWIVFEFLDLAEQSAGEQVGAAQSPLLGHGYRLFQMLPGSGHLRALSEPLKVGYATLVAGDADSALADLALLEWVVD